MTSTETIYQCQVCNRQFLLEAAGLGRLTLLERPRLVVPELELNDEPFHCGLADCAECAAANAQREQARLDRRMANRRERHEVKQQCQTARGQRDAAPNRGKSPSSPARMPYKDADEEQTVSAINSAPPVATNVGVVVEQALSHKDRQRDFVAKGKGDNDNERMLELLFDGFYSTDPTRTSRGRWISKEDLIFKHGILTPNSRASELRGSESHIPHPLVEQFRLEIDNSSNAEVTGHAGGVSCYSVCFIENSVRLEVERKNKEKGQASFA